MFRTDERFSGAVRFDGAVRFSAELRFSGAVRFDGAVRFSGALRFSGAVRFDGAVRFSGALRFSGAVRFDGAVRFSAEPFAVADSPAFLYEELVAGALAFFVAFAAVPECVPLDTFHPGIWSFGHNIMVYKANL